MSRSLRDFAFGDFASVKKGGMEEKKKIDRAH